MVWRGGGGQGSGVIHDSALGHAGERAPSFFRYKVLPLDHLLRFGALRRGLGNQSILPPWRRCRRLGVSYFAQTLGV
jgi:hypothetical protein